MRTSQSKIVRVVRIIEYIGPADAVDICLLSRSVKESYMVPTGVLIREAILSRPHDHLDVTSTFDLVRPEAAQAPQGDLNDD